jgi:hypothetical protein
VRPLKIEYDRGGVNSRKTDNMRHFKCRNCGNVLFFENSQCVQCGSQVGFEPQAAEFVLLGADSQFQLCQNGAEHAVCNWVVPVGCDNPLCPSCKLNIIIPDLTVAGNLEAWHKIEVAKRRILYTLAELGQRPPSRTEDAVTGVGFDFLRPTENNKVLTGHEFGIITLNVNEAEDDERAKIKNQMGESYRTLIGHFRHEIGHYYWDRFFQGRPDNDAAMLAFREIFGDEREDYDAALARHYANPAPAPKEKYISDYASVHPWEDWAETWAHYLHITDGAETALNFGLSPANVKIPFTPLPEGALSLPDALDWKDADRDAFQEKLEAWARLAPALNEIVASLGHEAFYPFVFSVDIVRKFSFVHYMVCICAGLQGYQAQPELAGATEPGTAAVQPSPIQPAPVVPPPAAVQQMQSAPVGA